MKPKLATEPLWWLWVKRLFETAKIKQKFFHTCGQKDGESHRSASLCKMDYKNNGTRPCKETSFSINNHKHVGLIIMRSFSYASCCFVVYDPLFTSSLPLFLKSLAGDKGLLNGEELWFFLSCRSSPKQTASLTWLWAEMCNCRMKWTVCVYVFLCCTGR